MTTDERKTKRQRAETSPAPATAYTLDSAVEMLFKRFDETNLKIDTFKEELNIKLDCIKADLQKQIDVVKQEIDTLKTTCDDEHSSLGQSLHKVNNRIDDVTEDFRRFENRTELIAVGIPYLSNENLQDYLVCMAKTIGFDESKISHIHCKRLHSKKLSDGDECFTLLQFSVACLRDEFYSLYLAKRDLRLEHIGISSDRRIYVNENLTMTARTIKKAALKLRRENKLAAVSTKFGMVHVRKLTNGPLVPVSSIEQLMQL